MNKVRLIDANALLLTFSEDFINGNSPKFRLSEIKTIIDNAPTINPFYPISKEEFYKITDAEWEHSDNFWITTPSGKKIEFEKKRPQGAWERDDEHSITFDIFKCSHCGGWGHTHFKFCPNCGASMRPKEN